MKNPLVSIIIPCYNVEKYLKACFNSLDSQTYKNLHVVFIDDGSADNTLKLLKNYCALHENYTLISGENQGVASSRNKGLSAIKGEYFCFVDADDIILPTHVERLVNNLLQNQADMAVCGIKRVSERKSEIFDAHKIVKSGKIRTYDKMQALCEFFSQKTFDYLLMNKIFCTDIAVKSGARFLDGTRYGEEGYFFFKYLSACEKTVYYPDKTYVYVQRKSSLMHSAFNESRLDIYKNLDEVINEAKDYSAVLPYVKVMRAGYSAGLLYFILRGKYKNSDVIARIVRTLNADVKSLKKAPKIALYKKICLPLVACVSKIVFLKHIKKSETK